MIWKNIAQPNRQQMATWRMRIACLIPKAINTHFEYVILIAFHGNNSCTNAPQCYVYTYINGKGKGKVHPCTGTEALYRPYDP